MSGSSAFGRMGSLRLAHLRRAHAAAMPLLSRGLREGSLGHSVSGSSAATRLPKPPSSSLDPGRSLLSLRPIWSALSALPQSEACEMASTQPRPSLSGQAPATPPSTPPLAGPWAARGLTPASSFSSSSSARMLLPPPEAFAFPWAGASSRLASSAAKPAAPPAEGAPAAAAAAAAAAGDKLGAAAMAASASPSPRVPSPGRRKRFSRKRIVGALALVSVLSGGAFFSTSEPGVVSDWSFRAVDLATPLLRLLDPEAAHDLAIAALAAGLGPREHRPDPPSLSISLWGRQFRNPLGLAAGWDKDARAVEGILSLGLGFMEVGSITPAPQSGNPKPRVFRLPEQKAVINRYGFNSEGIPAVAQRLGMYRGRRQTLEHPERRGTGKAAPSSSLVPRMGPTGASKHRPAAQAEEDSGETVPPAVATAPFLTGQLGVNLGKNKWTADAASDFVQGVYTLAQYADFLVINVSSPNTPGLRKLQGRRELHDLIKRVLAARDEMQWGEQGPPPLLVKVAPDLSEQDLADVAQVALSVPLDGLIVGNTTVSRPDSVLGLVHCEEAGGLSGKPLLELSTSVLHRMYALTHGKVTLIGCGGISSGEDAYRKIRAGASLVQIYTALVYEGLGVIPRIKEELAACLERDGFSNVSQAIGADHRR